MLSTTPSATKDALYGGFARIGYAFSNPLRLRLLELLAQGERTVDEVTEHTPLRRKNASAQLRVLREAGLVRSRREGRNVYYRLADARVILALRALQGLAVEASAELREVDAEFFGEPAPALDAAALAERLEGTPPPLLLDVRPAEEYEADHVPGARSLPLKGLTAAVSDLPRDREVLVFCRGPYCVDAVTATRLLQREGVPARRVACSIVEWRQAAGRSAA